MGTIVRDLSLPPQRRQGPDTRPLLLVGTHWAIGSELTYKLHVVLRSVAEAIIFCDIFFITKDVCMLHFYDLSDLIVCWSDVSLRRIIYNFLNVCPFDYTAFVVSGGL